MFTQCQGPIPAISLAFPDVCKTPPFAIPIPYPDIAMSSTAIPTVPNQFILCCPIHNLLTTTPLTNGDEPGVMGGVVSQMDFSTKKHMLGSFKVFSTCMPQTKMLMPTGQNGMVPNMVGVTLSPSQPKVLVLA